MIIKGNSVGNPFPNPQNGLSMQGTINMNGQPISGLNAPTENDQAANMGYVNQQVKKAAPYNYAHNSDFTQFVAQAGVGGLHGAQAYAGDRWILVSGTVSGDARADGNGYQNIKLNGTIKQKVANAPNGSKVAIEMVSGTANISFNNGEITITSSGGIIKNVLLCNTETLPEYQPKGYGAELAECQRYFERLATEPQKPISDVVYVTTSVTGFIAAIPYHRKRIVPTITSSGATTFETIEYNTSAVATGAEVLKELSFAGISRTQCIAKAIRNKAPGIPVFTSLRPRDSSAYIDISADL